MVIEPATAAPVTICVDPDPPPWTYWVRDAALHKTDKLAGFSVDLMREVFHRLGLDVEFIGNMPWFRCVKAVEGGSIDYVMNVYWDEDRNRRFVYSMRYDQLTPQVFYDAKRPINVEKTADLKRYHGCGLLHTSYAHYGLAAKDLNMANNNYEQVLQKLESGQCDYFVEELEFVAGYAMIGKDFLANPDLLHHAVEGAVPPSDHLMAGKGTKAAYLMPRVDAKIAEMVRTGEAARLWAKHALEIPYTP